VDLVKRWSLGEHANLLARLCEGWQEKAEGIADSRKCALYRASSARSAGAHHEIGFALDAPPQSLGEDGKGEDEEAA
jgi:hypothetical protein